MKIGRLPYSRMGFGANLSGPQRKRESGTSVLTLSGIPARNWLDAVGTPIAVQQKMMRHADIRTTMNIYGDIATDEMTTASSTVAQLAFPSNGAQAERKEA